MVVKRDDEFPFDEEMFKNFIKNSTVGFGLQQNLRAVFVNDAFTRTFKYDDPGEILELESFLYLWAPHERDRLAGYNTARMKGEPTPAMFEVEGVCKDGSQIWLELSPQVVSWDGKRLIATITNDITHRKIAEHALTDELRFRQELLDATQEGYWHLDADGKTLDANAALCAILGRPKEEIIGKAIHDFFDAENAKLFDTETDAGKLGKTDAYEIALQRPDGSNISCLNTATSIFDKTGMYIGSVGLWTNITERKRNEEVRNQLAAAIDHVPDIVSIYDASDRLIYANQALRELDHNISETLQVGATFEERMRAVLAKNKPMDAAGREEAWLKERLEKHNNPGPPIEITRQDGISLLLREYKLPNGSIINIGSNISVRKQAERDNSLLASAIDSLVDQVALYDTEDRLVFANARARSINKDISDIYIAGTKFEEIIRRNVANGMVVDAVGREDDWIQNRLELRRAGNWSIEYQLADGSWIATKDQVLPNGFVISVGIETTALKASEAALQQAQRMEAVGQLTGGISHDFNNLLAVILGGTEMLEGMVGDDEEIRGELDRIKQAVDRGASLTNQLLAFSRKQALSPATTNVDAVISGLEELLRRTLGETIDLKVGSEAGLWPVMIDPRQLENALINLAINARDAMRAGGSLVIKAAKATLDVAYTQRYEDLNAGDYVSVAVVDSGTGMTADEIGHAFEPFFTTKEVGQGSGLGLAMVYGFAKQSGGHVMIDSKLAAGTTVTLYLPRSKDALAGTGDPNVTTTPSGRERILLVEDDVMVCQVSSTLLRNDGYSVVEARDGIQALRIIEDGTPVDLLFLDMVLPEGMSGVELAKRVRRIRPEIEVVFTSGYTENAMLEDNVANPIAPLIKKPFRKAELLATIRAKLDERRN